MRISNPRRVAASLLVAFSTMALYAACSDSLVGVEDRSAAVTAANFSGEELYRGLVLGQGAVADLIPEVRRHYRLDLLVRDTEQRAAVQAVTDRLVARIAASEPTFFAGFRNDVTSGDHLRIQAALEGAAQLTGRVLAAMPEAEALRQAAHDPAELARVRAAVREMAPTESWDEGEFNAMMRSYAASEGSPSGMEPMWIFAAAAAIYLAVVHGAVVVYYAGVVYVAATYTLVGVDSAEQATVLGEQLVHSVATMLAL